MAPPPTVSEPIDVHPSVRSPQPWPRTRWRSRTTRSSGSNRPPRQGRTDEQGVCIATRVDVPSVALRLQSSATLTATQPPCQGGPGDLPCHHVEESTSPQRCHVKTEPVYPPHRFGHDKEVACGCREGGGLRPARPPPLLSRTWRRRLLLVHQDDADKAASEEECRMRRNAMQHSAS